MRDAGCKRAHLLHDDSPMTVRIFLLSPARCDGERAKLILNPRAEFPLAHALREHARARLAKSKATGMGLSIAAQLFGLGQLGDVAADLGTQLLTLKFSRGDETDADLVARTFGPKI